MDVGLTILNQIRMMDKDALFAWGATEFVGLAESHSEQKKHYGGLQFRIRTPKYKRGVRVIITLNGLDTYDIQVVRIAGASVRVLDNADGVYADMLVDVLDELIDNKEQIFF